MTEPRIIDRGRGPEIEGTRITVYDVMDYYKHGWHRDRIADTLSVSSDQVALAIRYIDEHRNEVMAVYNEMLERDARGNPPELQAKIDASRAKLLARVNEVRAAREMEICPAGNTAGRQRGPTVPGALVDLDV